MIPAYSAEWLLYSADPDFFLPHQGAPVPGAASEARLTADEVRHFVKAIGFTRWEITDSPRSRPVVDKWTGKIMASLHTFESHLNEDGKHHFRFELIRFVDHPTAALYDYNLRAE